MPDIPGRLNVGLRARLLSLVDRGMLPAVADRMATSTREPSVNPLHPDGGCGRACSR